MRLRHLLLPRALVGHARPRFVSGAPGVDGVQQNIKSL
jgi:hypothetical protein